MRHVQIWSSRLGERPKDRDRVRHTHRGEDESENQREQAHEWQTQRGRKDRYTRWGSLSRTSDFSHGDKFEYSEGCLLFAAWRESEFGFECVIMDRNYSSEIVKKNKTFVPQKIWQLITLAKQHPIHSPVHTPLCVHRCPESSSYLQQRTFKFSFTLATSLLCTS